MKYLLSILFILLAINTCKKADADDMMLRAVLDHNDPAERITYYSLFVYEAPDTLSSPFVQGGSPEMDYFRLNANSDSLIALNAVRGEIRFSVSGNGEYVQIALSATNEYMQSGTAVSGWLKKDFMIVPLEPGNLRIER